MRVLIALLLVLTLSGVVYADPQAAPSPCASCQIGGGSQDAPDYTYTPLGNGVVEIQEATPAPTPIPPVDQVEGLNPDLEAQAQAAALQAQRKHRRAQLLRAILIGGRVADAATTTAGLHHGLLEANPLMRTLTRCTPLFWAVEIGVGIVEANHFRKVYGDNIGPQILPAAISVGIPATNLLRTGY